MNPHNYGLILAGGRGTRFWPRSRKRSAKQVLDVAGERLPDPGHGGPAGAGDPSRADVDSDQRVPAPHHHPASFPKFRQHQVLAEPVQRNTAPAIGLAAHILRSLDPDAVMGVFPSDHVVGKPAVVPRAC